MSVIEIEVVYDFVCAWCYIGKRKLDRAIALYQKTYPGGRSDVFSIKWSPYFLNYNPHPHSVPKSDLVDERLKDMTPEQRTALFNRMNQIGRAVGIYFKAGGMIGSTRDAHRLVHLSRTKPADVQNCLVENILRAYHEMEMDISSKDVLLELALSAGLDKAEVTEWLESDLAGDIVDEASQRNRQPGNTGVPRYIIQGVHCVDGAEDPSEFIEVFAKVKEGENQA
ncbi:DsbA family oxidoreductase [Aspergillus clavatus NRRL 1]|uniref:Thioredoxin, putative n=1 Tax=Aspergillus clavatus (strain ATCC 1007 / CBS 513.65 / DSM 816 / NCTC 3887 / NRRL 1 / QM 1276 / 107) TaxID=344612 RepID=A1CLZ4_ASPCL|nr:thioredoxin, putative [Aspergillus clavatus NRRL 1]EAW09123.1 thioredoxin, putative [Aspergillus clavatus NRRL 1]